MAVDRAEEELDWPSAVALISSLLALLGVLVGGLFAANAQRSHWRFTEQIEACSSLLAEYSAVYVAYARAVHTGAGAKASSTTEFVDWVPFNKALDVVNLMGDAQIVEAAHHLDRMLWQVGLGITRGQISTNEWATARRPLEAARLRFVNVSRRRLGRSRDPLLALHGRPADDDPIWTVNP
jgi:hypothetical protein